ncbi:MAG: dihydroorotase [Chitinophagales bacterium]|nr:dihydroorotase [Chitinophagales bacterium]
MNIILRSATIIDPSSKYHLQQKDISIIQGRIAAIGNSLPADKNCQEINSPQLCVSPGWLDMFTFQGDPGYESKEDIESGTKAAASGGFTGICAMPNTKPALHSKSEIEYVINKAKDKMVEVYPIGAVSYKCEGNDITEMHDLHQAGAVAFSDGIHSWLNPGLMLRSLLYVKPFDGLIISHPHEYSLAKNGLMNEGVVSTSMGVPGIPNIAEELIVARDIYLAEYSGSKVHFAYISTEGSVELVRQAKKRGVRVSCSVSAYNLAYDDSVLQDYDTNLKVMPPLRSKTDNAALLKGLKDGTIDSISSVHIPQDIESKEVEFDHAEFGMIGLETAFALVNSAIGKKLDLSGLVTALSVQPRKLLGLEIAPLETDAPANLTIFDPSVEWTFTEKDIRSKSSNTPFVGKRLKGKVLGIVNKGQSYWN